MVSLDDAIILRYKSRGENYEVFVDADEALKFRSGEQVQIEDILASDTVFKDASAADKASEEHLMEFFNNSDMTEILREIILKGDLHLTTEQKKKMLEDRRKQVATMIATHAINPQTKTPHPLSRIEAAMEEAKVDITISKSAKEQVDKVMKALKPIIPIKFEKLQVAIQIPGQYAGKLYHELHQIGEIKREEWKGADQICLIEIPAGLQDELFSRLNNATHGSVKTKVVKHE